MINTDMILPESLRELVFKEIGPVPTAESPKVKKHTWITNALIRFGLISEGPLVNAIWYADPDGAAHSHGIGSELAVESLKIVDEEFGRILNHLQKTGLRARFNIIISTDHGFVTHTGKESLTTFLINKGFKKSPNSDDIIVAGGAIYLAVPDTAKIRKIVYELQQTPNVGAIFTRSRNHLSTEGMIEGTLSFASIHWDFKARTPDILVDVNWSDDTNTHGYKGSTTSLGVAGHGSLSPYETNIRLLVDGPGFKKGQLSKAPSANIDIAPTVLSLHKFKVPQHMDGRVLNELMVHGTANENSVQKIGKEVITVANQIGNTLYTLKLHRYTYMGKIYIDHAQTIRTVK
jgi:predicted AlkP superfamily pyrophosphatase or phosphodiesterase